MFRLLSITLVALVVMALPAASSAGEITGTYMEARTCQVYTGPCFANGEGGLAGQEAMMAWNIEKGRHNGVDLAGLKVIVVLRAGETLGFRGIAKATKLKSVVVVDEKASAKQREALIDFAKQHSGKAGRAVVRVDCVKIEMSLDTSELNGQLKAGKIVQLQTRKARESDCICMNETAYYPPLAKVENYAAGVAIEAKFSGRGLGTRWSMPNSRSVYMATFDY